MGLKKRRIYAAFESVDKVAYKLMRVFDFFYCKQRFPANNFFQGNFMHPFQQILTQHGIQLFMIPISNLKNFFLLFMLSFFANLKA